MIKNAFSAHSIAFNRQKHTDSGITIVFFRYWPVVSPLSLGLPNFLSVFESVETAEAALVSFISMYYFLYERVPHNLIGRKFDNSDFIDRAKQRDGMNQT